MSEAGITRYCLGTGQPQCDGCQMEANWNTLNQMPAARGTSLRHASFRGGPEARPAGNDS